MVPFDLLATEEIVLQRGDFLKVGGTIDTNTYYVVEGSLRLYLLEEEEQIIRLGYKDNIIAAIDSVLTGQPSDIFIQAIKKCRLKVIPKIKIDNYLEEDTAHYKMYVALLEQLIVQQMEREQDLLIKSPSERYHKVLKRSPQLFQEIPHKHIANYLRMSPETLSRVKNIDLNQA